MIGKKQTGFFDGRHHADDDHHWIGGSHSAF